MGKLQFNSDFTSARNFSDRFAKAIGVLAVLAILGVALFRYGLAPAGLLFSFLGTLAVALLLFLLFRFFKNLPETIARDDVKQELDVANAALNRVQRRLQDNESEKKSILSDQERATRQRERLHKNRIEAYQNSRGRVDAERQREENDLLDDLQRQHYQQGVINNPLSQASIKGVGPKTKANLTRYGIRTIEDLSYTRLVAVDGVGEKTANTILAWGRQVNNQIIRAQPEVLPPQLMQEVEAKYRNQHDEINREESSEDRDFQGDIEEINKQADQLLRENSQSNQEIKADLVEAEEEVRGIEARLDDYSEITFPNFLKLALFPIGFGQNPFRSWITLIPLVLLVGSICNLSSGVMAVGAIYVDSLPTATFTPSSTPTASNTPTATITNTPTITLTPTITDTPTITPTPSDTPTPSNTPTPTVTIPANTNLDCIPGNRGRDVAYVIQVKDGDTITVRLNGELWDVNYIGANAPESSEYYSYQAYLRNSQLVAGRWVTLVSDSVESLNSGELLRYVIAGDTFVNYQMVLEGFALDVGNSNNSSCNSLFADAETSARRTDAGLWRPTPTPSNTPLPTAIQNNTNPEGGGGNSGGGGDSESGSGDCDPNYPSVCIPSVPYDLDCGDVPYRNFSVPGADPHRFDRDNDGVGCES